MKYAVKRACDWKTFAAKPTPGRETLIDAADLTTADGEPLPADVVGIMVTAGCLVPVADDVPADPSAAAVKKKG